jgi:integrase
MTCPKCGKTVPDGSVFCNYCGKKLSVQKRKAVKVRGNGMGCAYKRGRTWTACVTVDWISDTDPSKPKKPIRRTRGGFASKADAIAYCPVLLAGGVEKPAEAPRLSSYWKTYSEGPMLKISKGKQSAYKTAWKKLKPIHDVRVDVLTVDLLQKTISETCTTFDPAKDCKSLLSNLFEIAAAEKQVVRDLPSFITLPEHEPSEPISFNADEQKKIWQAYDNGDRRAAVHLLMIYTGMMPGELMNLKAENIHLDERIILRTGLKTKIRKRTPVVLADCILPVVEDLIEHAMPSGYIWARNEERWYANYHALLNENGCRDLPPYSCRHTTATALAVDKNVAPQTIKKIMRWSTVRMLDHYAHPDTSDALEGVNTMAKPTADDEQKQA